MKITAEPRSDQWNADDFIGSPRTFTIAGVKPGSAEQKYDIELVEGEGRAWRPPLTVLRLLIAAWGDEASAWVGRRVTLYRDAKVAFGPDAVGGIRVSHMSDLPGGKRFQVRLTSARGKKSLHTVEPLAETAPPATKPTPEQMREIADGFTAAEITDNAGKAKFLADAVGREMNGWGDLTADDADVVIAALKRITTPLDPDDPWAADAAKVAARDEEAGL